MLLVGAIEACAVYQGLRAVVAFRAARSPADVEGANLRALSAIAFTALGMGGALRYIGIALFGLFGAIVVRNGFRARRMSHPPKTSTVPSMSA